MSTIYRSDVSYDEFYVDRIKYKTQKGEERDELIIKLEYIVWELERPFVYITHDSLISIPKSTLLIILIYFHIRYLI